MEYKSASFLRQSWREAPAPSHQCVSGGPSVSWVFIAL